MAIIPRQLGFYGYGDNCYNNGDGTVSCYNSPWYSWGRWVLLGVLIFVFLLVFIGFSCLSARRRRQAGRNPYPGTAWTLGRTPPGHAAAQYTTQQPYTQQYTPQTEARFGGDAAAPPAYSAPNGGYYNRDVELQQPANTYKAPNGPPPGR